MSQYTKCCKCLQAGMRVINPKLPITAVFEDILFFKEGKK